jgi:hypothetical protein
MRLRAFARRLLSIQRNVEASLDQGDAFSCLDLLNPDRNSEIHFSAKQAQKGLPDAAHIIERLSPQKDFRTGTLMGWYSPCLDGCNGSNCPQGAGSLTEGGR